MCVCFSDGNVKLAQALDYETVKTYTCGFNVSDGTATGGPFMYTLTVQDANEAPYFSDTMYYATTSEGAVSGNLIHVCLVDSPIILNWINLFPKLGMSSIFISIFILFLTDIPLRKQRIPR
ncbi:hypothetical protein DPMN_047294 [Dreissena polymorpha]|uniref:Cadherin domain-containing protein n=1 Tax=Dreissena polymorpha TaxID=45954 RepID=A0A9D4D7U7_DREPO|nr:hypothetical protein DPMN_046951 [Dreissena polymorpha]KAH3740588.1 hypothetical protein DPMN_047294 [Dreissena polymorpha]